MIKQDVVIILCVSIIFIFFFIGANTQFTFDVNPIIKDIQARQEQEDQQNKRIHELFVIGTTSTDCETLQKTLLELIDNDVSGMISGEKIKKRYEVLCK